MKTLHVGIATYDEIKAHTLAVAKGTQRRKKDDPTIWFTSVESFAKVLSARNRALLDLITRKKPGSLAELEKLSGRAKSNLSRTLKTMARYGLVDLLPGEGGKLVAHVPYDRIKLDLPLQTSTSEGARRAA